MEDTKAKDHSPEKLMQLIDIQHEEILLLSNRLEKALNVIEALSKAVFKPENTEPTQPNPALPQASPHQLVAAQQSQDTSVYVSQMETDTTKVSEDNHGKKRKRTKKKNNPAPKKKDLEVDTQPTLEPASANSSSDTESEQNSDTEPNTPPPSKSSGVKVPPIIMRTKANSLNVIRDLSNHGIKVKEAINRADCIRLHVESADDFREVTRQFKEKQIPFHTYQLNEDKLLKVVIRGIPEDIEPDEIKLALEELKYPVISVTRMKSGPTRKPLPMVLVQLNKSEGKEIFQLTNILFLRVRVESLRRRSEITQCHRCQKFGHGANNCHVPPKCVKCAEGHHTSQCKKSKDTPAKCANCGEPHAASYRGCKEAPKRRKQQNYSQSQPSSVQSSTPALASPPKLDKGTFAEVSKNKNANATPSTSTIKQNTDPNTTTKKANTADTLITLLNILTELNSAKSSAEQIPILLKAITKLQQ